MNIMNMKIFILCAPALVCLGSLQAMEKSAQLASTQLARTRDEQRQITSDVFLKTSDGKKFLMNHEKAKLCEWFVVELAKNQKNTGDNPLIIPISLEQLRNMDILLGYAQKEDFIKLEYNELCNRDLVPLADVIKTAWTLQCTSVCDLAKKVFVQKLKDEHLKDFETQNQFISSLGFTPELVNALGKILLSKDDLNYVRSLLFTQLDGEHTTSQVGFNLSNDHLLACGASPDGKGFCDMWDVSSGERVAAVVANSPIGESIFLNTPLFATLSEECGVVWNVITGKEGRKVEPKDSNQSAVKFDAMCVSSDGTILAYGVGKRIILANVRRKNVRILSCTDEGKDIGQIAHLLFTPDNSILIEIRSTGLIRFWQIKTESCIVSDDPQTPIVKFHCNKNGVLATADREGKLCLWDCASGKLLNSWDKLPKALCFNNAGDKLAVSTESEGGTVFDITRKELSAKNFKERDCTLIDGAYHPDDTILATSTANNEICLWDTKESTLLARLVAEKLNKGLVFSSDGNILASSHAANGKIRLWHYCNKDIERYLNDVNLSKGLLLLLILDAKRKGLPLEFLKSGHLKAIYESLDFDLLRKFLK